MIISRTKIKLFLTSKKTIEAGVFLSVFLVFFTALLCKKNTINVPILSYLQIATAMEWLNGNFFWPGPEVPYRKFHLPGPFMYFLLTPPLVLSETPYAGSLIWLIFWMSMTFSIAFMFIKSLCKNTLSPLFFLLLFFTSPFLFSGMMSYLQWNALFSFVFHLLILIFLYYWKEKKEDIHLLFLGITMGLGAQVHISIWFHLITLTLFLITDRRLQNSLGLFRVNPDKPLEYKPFQWRYLSACMMFFIFPQTPYLAALINEELYIQSQGFYRFLQSFRSFFSNPLEESQKIIFSLNINQQKLTGLFLICMALLIYKFFRKAKIYRSGSGFPALSLPEKPQISNRLGIAVSKSFIVLALIVIIPALAGFVFADNLFFARLFALILFIKWHDNLWPQKSSLKYAVFILYGLFSAFESYKREAFPIEFAVSGHLIFFIFSCILFAGIYFYNNKHKFLKTLALIFILTPVFYSVSITSRYQGSTYKLKEAMKLIYKQTGWVEETAVNRIFKIGSKPEWSFSFSYLQAVEEARGEGPPSLKEKSLSRSGLEFSAARSSEESGNIDKKPKSLGLESKKDYAGYFLADKKVFSGKDWNQKIRDELLSRDIPLPAEVKQEIQLGNLQLQPPQHTSSYHLIPYTVKKESLFPEGFHNGPVTYKEKDWFQESCYFPGLFKKDGVFYFCYFFEDYIEAMAVALKFFQKDNQTFFLAEITGPSLALISSDRIISYHFVKNLRLELICGKKETISLLSHIGLNKNAEFHKSLFTPVTIRKSINCPLRDISKMTVFFEHQRLEEELSPYSFKWEL